MNKNLPPIQLYVRNEFLFNQKSGHGQHTWCTLISVRALQNQAFQFSALLDNGALFTGLPANAFCFETTASKLPLNQSQLWDCISAEIDVITLDTLRYMPCTVKLGENIVKAQYHFSVDFVGNNDLSRNPIHWKTLHALQTEDGNLVFQPQYRIQFQDSALAHNAKNGLPKYDFNENIWTCED